MQYSFKEIKSLFSEEEWDISYLTSEEMIQIFNMPIKLFENSEDYLYRDEKYYLIGIKKTTDYDYSLGKEFCKKIKNYFPLLNIEEIFCNYKQAAILSGLGRQAKNSLIYHNKFQFDTHITMAGINDDLIDLPIRNKPDFEIYEMCKNCNDCIKACPVQAIHADKYPYWNDSIKCDNFCLYGNHEIIPSLKMNWYKIEAPYLTEEQLFQIKDPTTCFDISKKEIKSFFYRNGIQKFVQYPVCRECASQKCTKYKGKYPYDINNVKIFDF